MGVLGDWLKLQRSAVTCRIRSLHIAGVQNQLQTNMRILRIHKPIWIRMVSAARAHHNVLVGGVPTPASNSDRSGKLFPFLRLELAVQSAPKERQSLYPKLLHAVGRTSGRIEVSYGIAQYPGRSRTSFAGGLRTGGGVPVGDSR